MDKETMEQLQLMMNMMERMEATMVTKDEALLKEDIEEITDRAGNKARAVMEESIGKRLDALTEGLMLHHEKQGEMEHRVDTLERKVENLENRTA